MDDTNASKMSAITPVELELLSILLEEENVHLSYERTIPRRAPSDRLPLSFAQERLWFIDQLDPMSPAYNMPLSVRLTGLLSIAALEDSLGEIGRRHETLRTTVAAENGRPVQLIAPARYHSVPIVDLTAIAEPEQPAVIEELATAEVGLPFDLSKGPLLRTRLLRLAEQESVFLLSMHHIISDGWSLGILNKEMVALYEPFVAGSPSPLEDPEIQYGDFAIWQRDWLQGDVLESQLAYWRRQLGGTIPVLEMPTDRPRPAVQTNTGNFFTFEIPRALGSSLRELSQREGATLFMSLLAAFKVLLGRYSGQEDIIVGSPIANRDLVEIEPLIGFFVNTLILRTIVSTDLTFRELLSRVREVAVGAYGHQDLPFEQLVNELHPERDMSHTPLFQVMFVMQNAPMKEVRIPGLALKPVSAERRTAKFDLMVSLSELNDGIAGGIEYNTDLFDASTMFRFISHFQMLLESVVEDADERLSDLPVLSNAERHQLLVEWNDTEVPSREDSCIHHIFEDQVERTPDAVSVVFEDASLTYRDLNRRANRLAHYLRARGIGPEARIGICLDRSLEMVISLLAINKAGAAYVPLDSAQPEERLSLILKEVQVPVVITRELFLERLPQSVAQIVDIDAEHDEIARRSDENPETRASGRNLAYVIYTSGSTGIPKGVMVEHHSIVNYVERAKEAFGLESGDSVLQFASINFDTAAEEIFPCLTRGARLVLRTDEMLQSGSTFLKETSRHGVTVLDLPTAYWHEITNEAVEQHLPVPEGLRLVIIGGEAALADRLDSWRRWTGDRVQLLNTYGPTESTVVATSWELQNTRQPAESGRVPIGQAIGNAQAFVLDERALPVGIGITGELYIGGRGIARGYANRPDLTADRFVPDPDIGRPGARIYKTGDFARRRGDGQLEYISRRDNQVKIRGYRIELGEIESALAGYPKINESVVLSQQMKPGDKRIVAYIVPVLGTLPAPKELRRFLAAKLPEYMLPTVFVSLERLPLTPNNKVDRNALAALDWERPDPQESYLPPRTISEEVLAGIWEEVLGAAQVGIHHNFFELGGHSLLATQVTSRVREAFQIELPLRAMFEMPTVAALAEHIEKAKRLGPDDAVPRIEPVPRKKESPLSFAQQRLWFLNQLAPESTTYILSNAMWLEGRLSYAGLALSLDQVVRRHEVLRTTFAQVDGEPVQVLTAGGQVSLPLVDLSCLSEDDRRTQIWKLSAEEARRVFNLAEGPLVRARLVKLSPQQHFAVFTIHHIVSDGWSMGIMVREISALYEALSHGAPSALPELPIQYADYAVWQRRWLSGERLEEQLGYWRAQLAGIEPLQLPTDRARPAQQSNRGKSRRFVLKRELSQGLKRVSREESATLFMTMLSSFQGLMSRYSGQRQISVGTPVAGRKKVEVENLIGFFVNTLVIRNEVEERASHRQRIREARQAVLEADRHQDVPFEKLVEELQPERDMSREPLVQVMMAMQNLADEKLELGELSIRGEWKDSEATQYDLTMILREQGEEIVGTTAYKTELFDETTIERLQVHWERWLEEVVRNVEGEVREVEMMSEEERHQALVEWNDTIVERREGETVGERIGREAWRRGEGIAVVYEGEHVTYGELERRAERVARYLRREGVREDECVGVWTERSLELVVGVVGVIKAGGAYVPMEPGHPQERLRHMVEEAGIKIVLSQRALLDVMPDVIPAGVKVVCLDSDWESIESGDGDEGGRANINGDNLAYVIYTSGSTGTPKGAMNTQRGIVNRLDWMQETYALNGSDRVLQKTPFTFDVSVWEFFWPLITGATLVVAAPGVHQDADALIDLIRREEITTAHFVPAMLQAFLEGSAVYRCSSLKRLICSGEALPSSVENRFFNLLGAELHNLYGPTEAAVDVTSWRCAAGAHQSSVPIGRPIANTEIRILDQGLRPVPAGIPGELHIAGMGLARGYLNRPDLTAEKFTPDPLGQPGGRLYKTGDLTRYLADGAIDFLGRTDFQVKIRGLRIELGEIEAALGRHELVQDAVVAANDVSGDKSLMAYVVPRQDKAFFLRRLIELEREGRLDRKQCYELPNGMVVAHLNRGETEFLYNEIFEQRSYSKNGISLSDGDVIFDVGANTGMFSLFVRQSCKTAEIYAFEPIPAVFEVLRTNADLFALNTRLFQCGLSDISELTAFTYYPHCSIVSGRFADSESEREVVKSVMVKQGRVGSADENGRGPGTIDELLSDRLASQQVECELRTLSEVIAEYNVQRIDLLKIDVEKSEQKVLLGIEEGDWPKINQVIVEVHDIEGRLHEVRSLLRRKGFSVTTDQDLLFQDRGLYNIYGVRVNAPLHRQNGTRSPEALSLSNSPDRFINTLRAELKEELPEYMIPTAFVMLLDLPLTSSGKVDRNALPPFIAGETPGQDEMPRTAIEEIVAGIWAEVLRLDRVGLRQDFFELGGHSLLATRVMSRVRESFRVELPLRAIFDAPTVAGLAKQVENAIGAGQAVDLSPINRLSRDEQWPLSLAQQRIWFIHQVDPDSPAYNISSTLRLEGQSNIAAMEQILGEIIRRHEVLRTVFAMRDEQVMQIVGAAEPMSLPIVDLGLLSEAEFDREMRKLSRESTRRPFDLARGPLLRSRLLRFNSRVHLIQLAMHHIVSDGWSMGILVREVSALYEALSRGLPSTLPELPIQYSDYAVWQRGWLSEERLEEQLRYWRAQLAGIEPLQLPTDRARPAQQNNRGKSKRFVLKRELSQGLKRVSREESATLFMTMLSSFQGLMSRYSGQRQISVGTPVAGRKKVEVENLIGFFVNTLVIKNEVEERASHRERIRAVRQAVLEADRHQDVPFEKLVEELQPERDMSREPLVQVMMAMQNLADEKLELGELSIRGERINSDVTQYDLTMTLSEQGEEIVGATAYKTELFDETTIERLQVHWERWLEEVVRNVEGEVREVEMMSEEERHQALVEWNDTRVDRREGETVGERIGREARRRGEAIAVVYEGEHVTYGELERRAERVARYLRREGVREDECVGVLMERSLELVVGMVGVIKAGGAYVPLEPGHPQERLRHMVEEAGIKIVLSQGTLLDMMPNVIPAGVQIVCLDSDWEAIESGDGGDGGRANIKGDNLAYVIYTSGSTGTPKGAMNTHAAIMNRLTVKQDSDWFGEQDRILQKTPIGFDVGVREIFWPLTHGSTIVVARPGGHLDPRYLINITKQEQITILDFVPAMLQAFLEEEGLESCTTLKQALCGGDVLTPETRDRFSERLDAQLINLYGPAEAAIDVTIWSDKQDGDLRTVPIGKPTENVELYVLDQDLKPVPIGLPGELYIGGPAVGRGYLNRPDLTSERFLPNLFSRGPGGRLYRTGDLVKYQTDGNIVFLGRADSQVKIRGVRIETGEIETLLSRHNSVKRVVVVASWGGEDKKLIAYIVTEPDSEPNPAELRRYLRESLPEYMMPSAFVFLKKFPISANGKIDSGALPLPDGLESIDRKAFIAPRTPVEEELASIWREVLKVDLVGMEDDFFVLGGHSLLLILVNLRIRQAFQIDLPLRVLFEARTIAEITLAIAIAQLELEDSDEVDRLLQEINQD